jgi:hypothetical protein
MRLNIEHNPGPWNLLLTIMEAILSQEKYFDRRDLKHNVRSVSGEYLSSLG